MIKYLFILINSLAVFLYSLFSGDGGITVTSNIPKTIAPGQEVLVELKVTKGSMGGFAKLQLDLPSGFTARESDNRGASFSMSDGLAKWVWASLPSDEVLVVKCVLIAGSDVSGVKNFGAKYSYVDNNAKVVVEMNPVEVTIGAEAATTEPVTTTTTEPVSTETVASNENAANTETTPVTTTPNTNSEPAGNITIERKVTRMSDGEYSVNIKISKGATGGFARYSDDIQADAVYKSQKSDGASFSVSDGKLKFVWVKVPDKDILEVTYVATGVKTPWTLNGEYSYLEQNQSKTYNVQPETIMAASMAIETNTGTVTEPVNTNTAVGTPVNTSTPEVAGNNNNNTNNTGNENPVNTNTVTETLPKKDVTVNYMVQIGAFTNSEVSTSKLSKKFSISEKIKSEMAGGFSKFMVGDHVEYKDARDHRERMRNNNGVRTAFVVAYNTGRRITVQEALMISNQKWFR